MRHPGVLLPSVHDRSVHHGLELAPDWVGARREKLRHEDGDELLPRVNPEGGAGSAAPGELAGRAADLRQAPVKKHGEAEPEARSVRGRFAELAGRR